MAQCITPFTVKDKLTGDSIPVPCGKCPPCFSRRISGWSFRLMQQDKVSYSSHFLTLTYDTKHLPISKNGIPTLTKGQQGDLTLFFKKLRQAHVRLYNKLRIPLESRRHIKYYACGEYGHRDHGHIIMYSYLIVSMN